MRMQVSQYVAEEREFSDRVVKAFTFTGVTEMINYPRTFKPPPEFHWSPALSGWDINFGHAFYT